MLLCCISASSAHIAPRRSAARAWEFEFEKNPQNTEQPVVRKTSHLHQLQHRQRHTPTFTACACGVSSTQVMPSPALSPREAVTVQLQAISNNDHPW